MIGAGGFFSAITKPFRAVASPLLRAGGALIGGAVGGPTGAAIGNVAGGALGSAVSGGGGGGGGGYVSPYLGSRDASLQQGLTDRASLGFKPLTGKEGVESATAGLNFTGANQAVEGLGTAGRFEGSNPYQFNFKGLPDMYNKLAYARGAQNLQREGASNLQSLKEAVGTRRPGLLANIGQQQQRGTQEQLAGLQSDLGLKQMEQDVDLAKQQQTYQADEDYRTLQGADEARRARLASLGEIGTKVPALESDILERQREYQDKPLDYLRDIYGTDVAASSGQAGRGVTSQGQLYDFLTGTLGKAKDIYK